MSLQLIPSFGFHRYTLRYVLFAFFYCVIAIVLFLYAVPLLFLRIVILLAYVIINYIQSIPLSSFVYKDKLVIGSFVLQYSAIKEYRLVTRYVNKQPVLYGIRIHTVAGPIYYYLFHDSLPHIRAWVAELDHYVARSPDVTTSLYEELLYIVKL